jgi:hypothetical protein
MVGKDDSKKELEPLDHILKKHNLGNLTFTDPKLADKEGFCTYMEQTTIQGNLASGILIVRVKNSSISDKAVYDLFFIEKDKKERDEKKKQREDQESKDALKNLKENEQKNLEEEDKNDLHHQKVVSLLKEMKDENKNEAKVEVKPEDKSEANSEIKPEEDPEEEEIPEDPSNPNSKKISKQQERVVEKRKKRGKKMIQNAQKVLDEKSKTVTGNKLYRRFIEDITAKYKFEQLHNFRYFEVKRETTEMVIDSPKVFKFQFKTNGIDTHYMIVGDLQLKSKTIGAIDPNYKHEDVYKDHFEFLERIKMKEEQMASMTKHDENKLEHEDDDKDMIGCCSSSDDENSHVESNIESDKKS